MFPRPPGRPPGIPIGMPMPPNAVNMPYNPNGPEPQMQQMPMPNGPTQFQGFGRMPGMFGQQQSSPFTQMIRQMLQSSQRGNPLSGWQPSLTPDMMSGFTPDPNAPPLPDVTSILAGILNRGRGGPQQMNPMRNW